MVVGFFCFVLNVDTLLGSVVDSTESPDGLALSQLQRVEREIRVSPLNFWGESTESP